MYILHQLISNKMLLICSKVFLSNLCDAFIKQLKILAVNYNSIRDFKILKQKKSNTRKNENRFPEIIRKVCY